MTYGVISAGNRGYAVLAGNPPGVRLRADQSHRLRLWSYPDCACLLHGSTELMELGEKSVPRMDPVRSRLAHRVTDVGYGQVAPEGRRFSDPVGFVCKPRVHRVL